MTEQQFEELIDEMSDELWDGCYGSYLCTIIDYPFKLRLEFVSIFKPQNKTNGDTWFGCQKFKNQADRFIALYLFKEICIDEGIYKKVES